MCANKPPVVVFSNDGDRVKMIDVHPKEPLLIAALYTGKVTLWNYDSHTLLKTFDTGTGLPVRCAKFIPRLQAFACGCDDYHVRVYKYDNMERIAMFPAHDDFIRSLAVHHQLPLLLTCADDMTIRHYDWSKGWALQALYEGHESYCMAVCINPNDSSTFASASMDQTVKVWSFNNPTPNFTLIGHEDGVNCVAYSSRGDKPYLLSGSDDRSVRLWDYQTKACLQVFSFHTENVTAVMFHPDLPLIFSVAEDTETKVISTETFRLLYNLDHSNKGRAWTLASARHSNILAIGYDNGMSILRVGEVRPVYSMDSNGRVVVAVENELTRIDIKGVPADTPDGEIINCVTKDMGNIESAAVSIAHAANGQYMAIIGERDYNIISSLSLRPKSYGPCVSFVWGPESGSYAVLESPSLVKIFKSFKEQASIMLPEASDKLFTGPLLGIRTRTSVVFYDWGTLSVVRQIDETPASVEWSGSKELVALVTGSSIFILKFNAEQVEEFIETNGSAGTGEGLDFSFDLVEELEEKARDVVWVGDCLVFVNQSNRLNYYIGGETTNLAVVPPKTFLLGYLAKEDRLIFIDRERNVTTFLLKVSVIEYMTAIVREDFDRAASLLTGIEERYHPKLARFLQSRNLLELALGVASEDDLRFDLAIQLQRMDVASQIAARSPSNARWKQIGDMALQLALFDIAVESYERCEDYAGLLLIYSATGDVAKMSSLGDACLKRGRGNVAFTCFHKAGRHHDCVELLTRTGKCAEAAFYARTYCPELIEDVVLQWKTSLASLPRLQESIADPRHYPNLFPGIKLGSEPRPTAAATAVATTAPVAVPEAPAAAPPVIPSETTSTPHADSYPENPSVTAAHVQASAAVADPLDDLNDDWDGNRDEGGDGDFDNEL